MLSKGNNIIDEILALDIAQQTSCKNNMLANIRSVMTFSYGPISLFTIHGHSLYQTHYTIFNHIVYVFVENPFIKSYNIRAPAVLMTAPYDTFLEPIVIFLITLNMFFCRKSFLSNLDTQPRDCCSY